MEIVMGEKYGQEHLDNFYPTSSLHTHIQQKHGKNGSKTFILKSYENQHVAKQLAKCSTTREQKQLSVTFTIIHLFAKHISEVNNLINDIWPVNVKLVIVPVSTVSSPGSQWSINSISTQRMFVQPFQENKPTDVEITNHYTAHRSLIIYEKLFPPTANSFPSRSLRCSNLPKFSVNIASWHIHCTQAHNDTHTHTHTHTHTYIDFAVVGFQINFCTGNKEEIKCRKIWPSVWQHQLQAKHAMVSTCAFDNLTLKVAWFASLALTMHM